MKYMHTHKIRLYITVQDDLLAREIFGKFVSEIQLRFYIGDFVMTINGKGIGVSLGVSNWSKSSLCSFPCFLKHKYSIYSDCNVFYKRVP